MKLSIEGRNTLIKAFEGCKLVAYYCPAGKLTIGWGHTSAAGKPVVTEGFKITKTEADAILSSDLGQYEKSVNDNVKVPLTQNQFDALVDFTYNVGSSAFKTSTLLKKLNAGQYKAIPAEFMKWVHGPGGVVLQGLVRRRSADASWWATTSPEIHDEEEQRVTPEAPAVKSIMASKQGNAAIITTALGGIGAAKDIVSQAQDASDLLTQAKSLIVNTNFLIMVVIVIAGIAIWYWRNKHIQETGE